jgi:hypothetical protein
LVPEEGIELDTIKKREEEATSKETLEDIEESEVTTDKGRTRDKDGPSPDGVLDEPEERDDAGPM